MQVFIVLLVEFSIENVSFAYNQKMKARRPILLREEYNYAVNMVLMFQSSFAFAPYFSCLLNFYACLILYLTPYLVEVKMNDCQRGSNNLLSFSCTNHQEGMNE